MTTVVEVVDSAVKIGLGALITGAASFFLAKTNQIHESKRVIRDEKVKLIREYSLHIEHIESNLNTCIIQVDKKDYVSAQSVLATACNEAYSARSIANLLSGDKLAVVTDRICYLAESIYPKLGDNERRDEMFKTIEEITSLKKEAYPVLRALYLTVNGEKAVNEG